MNDDMKRWDKQAWEGLCLMVLILAILGFAIYMAIGELKEDESTYHRQCMAAGNGVSVCEVPQPNGKTTTCIESPGGLFGGGDISCDWSD